VAGLQGFGLLLALLVAVLALASASALAEPVCTDTWTGPSEGAWQTASNWSTGIVPSSTDVACIGAGETVNVTAGTNQTGVLLDKGTLVIGAGSLEIANALEASSASAVTLENGTLTGAGTLDVSGSFSWSSGGTQSGSGSTVVMAGASAAFSASGNMNLAGRVFVNEGTTTMAGSEGTTLVMSENARFKNKGTFKANVVQGQGYPSIKAGEGTAPLFVNTGTFEKTEGTGMTVLQVGFENQGTVNGGTGSFYFGVGSVTLSSGSVLEGTITLAATATGGSFNAQNATVTLGKTLSITGGNTATIGTLIEGGGASTTLSGAGTLDVSGSFSWAGESTMSGSGSTVVLPGVPAAFSATGNMYLAERTFVNEGTITMAGSGNQLVMSEGAQFNNSGTFKANAERSFEYPSITPVGIGAPLFVNTGAFVKTEGTGTTVIEVDFVNLGTIKEETGKLKFRNPVFRNEEEEWGEENPSAANPEQQECGEGVNCATGNLSETQTDFAVGGRGVGLDLTRTYNSQAAAKMILGAFGYGWSSSFSDHIVVESASKKATLHQANGGTVSFTEGSGGAFTAPEWSQDILSGSKEAGYSLTLENQTVYKFAGSTGVLESVTDRNGNATTLTYEGGRLITITDPAGRTIKLTYNGEGLVESAEDPLKHVVKYTYNEKQLASVTQPAEAGLRWQFVYDGEHQLKQIDQRIHEPSGHQADRPPETRNHV
jgi:YD repeat-containing protein